MKADKLTITLSIFSLLFAGLLYYFSLCDPCAILVDRPFPFNNSSFSSLYSSFCSKRAKIGGIFLIGIISFHLISYVNLETDKKKWLRAFLRHVIKQDLGGDQYETRITIFREQLGIRFWPRYIYRCILKRKNFWRNIKHLPSPIDSYLMPYIRYSYPNAIPSTSYFSIPRSNDDIAESVVSQCYKKGRPVNVNAPYIQNIHLPDNIEDLDPQDRIQVDEYLSKTFMADYGKLKMIDRRSNHLYAALIQHDNEQDNMRWGVIVFDINSEKRDEDIESKLVDVISSYLKITQFSLKIIH